MKRDAVSKLAAQWLGKLGLDVPVYVGGKAWRDADCMPSNIPAWVAQVRATAERQGQDEDWIQARLSRPNHSAAFLGQACHHCQGMGITSYQRRKPQAVAETIVHEALHLLFPKARHWWIEVAAAKLVGNPADGRYATRYAHDTDDVPSKAALLDLCRAQSAARR